MPCEAVEPWHRGKPVPSIVNSDLGCQGRESAAPRAAPGDPIAQSRRLPWRRRHDSTGRDRIAGRVAPILVGVRES